MRAPFTDQPGELAIEEARLRAALFERVRDFNALAEACHTDAIANGWHNDPRSGRRIDHNFGQMMMLAVSEVCEASYTLDGRKDPHLPARPALDVELADIAIRLFDTAAFLEIDVGGAADELLGDMERIRFDPGLFGIVRELSSALEGDRKGEHDEVLFDRPKVEVRIAAALLKTFAVAWFAKADLMGAIVDKRAYNRQRSDHRRRVRY